jgi:hypothetical protein
VTICQADDLVMVRDEGGRLDIHLSAFADPMGLTLRRERLAFGASLQSGESRDVPAVAAKLDPPGGHETCFLPRHGRRPGRRYGPRR